METSGGPRHAFDAGGLPSPGTPVAPRGRYKFYGCGRHRHGNLCTNALRVRVDTLNEAVLCAVEERALTPEAFERVVRLTEREEARDERAVLEREQAAVETRIRRLLDALEQGGDAPSLVARVRELEARQSAIRAELSGLRPVPRLAPQVVEDRLAEWRRLLRQSITQGRAVLQRALRGRLRFVPTADQKGHRFEGETRFDKLFAGVAVERPAFVRPGDDGTTHLSVDDTLDADYGHLLESARPRGSWKRARRVGDPGGERTRDCLTVFNNGP